MLTDRHIVWHPGHAVAQGASPCPMISKTRCSPYLKPHWTRSCARSGGSVAVNPRPARLRVEKVCRRLTWRMTYSRRRAGRCTSPTSSRGSTAPSAWRWTARAWSPPSRRKSRAATGSCAPRRTRSAFARKRHDPARHLPADHRRLARRLSPSAHHAPRRSPSAGLVDLSGPALSVAHHLDQRASGPELECRVLLALAVSVGPPGAVSPDPGAGAARLSRTAGRRSG